MILPLRVRGSAGRNAISFGATAAPSRLRAWPSSSMRRSSLSLRTGLQRNERLDDFADHGVGLADDPGFGDRGMLHQRALDLERADQVPGRLDHVVGAADEPVSSRPRRAWRGRRSGSSRRRSTCGSALPGRDSRGTSTASRPAARARLPRRAASIVSTPPSSRRRTIARVDAGQRLAHRAGLDVHGRRVGDHDAAGLGLPPVVVDRQAEHFLAPPHRLRVQRLADARDEAQVGSPVPARDVGAALDQHPDRRRRGVPDA